MNKNFIFKDISLFAKHEIFTKAVVQIARSDWIVVKTYRKDESKEWFFQRFGGWFFRHFSLKALTIVSILWTGLYFFAPILIAG